MLRLAFAVATLTALGACKSAEGEACQVDDDCKGSLVCSRNLRVCVVDPGGGNDAAVDDTDGAPADAWPIDGGEPPPPPDAAEPPDAAP
jgi:hypothetical protein